MTVFLALDIGERRIGVAVGNDDSRLARPLAVIHHVSKVKDAAQLTEMIKATQATALVVGCPHDPEGQPTDQGKRICRYTPGLLAAGNITLPVTFWDESFSTKKAQQLLLDTGAKAERRHAMEDAAAAAVILQDYLDHLQRG